MPYVKNVVIIFIFISFLQLIGCGGGNIPPIPKLPPIVLGEITINITGLPVDIDADVVLIQFKDPISTVWNITETRTFTNLQPGTYNVGTESFSIGLIEFIPDTGRGVTFELLEGETKTIDVDYSSRDISPGSIVFAIDQSSVTTSVVIQDIIIEGPENYSFSFNADSTMIGLTPGIYRVIAPDFVDDSQGYGFLLDKGSFLLEEGEVENNSAEVIPVEARVKLILDKPIQSVIGIPDSQGNTYTVQNLPNGITFGVSTNSLLKWDSNGNSIWSKIIPDQKYSLWSWRITTDINDNIYLVGFEDRGNLIGVQIQNLPSKIYKYDSSGNQLWSKVLENLSGGDLSIIDAIGIQDKKIAIFATKSPVVGNIRGSREALISIVDANNGNVLDSISDNNIDSFRQLKVVENQGYWILASSRIIHYSANGNKIEGIDVSYVEPIFSDITGGVVFQPDPDGGLYVMGSVNGLSDSDINLLRYSSDLTQDWEVVLSNPGRQYPIALSHSSTSSQTLINFGTDEDYNSVPGNQVFIELDDTGQQNWHRQFFQFGGLNVFMEGLPQSEDWLILTNAENGGGHYGKGNNITLGP